MTPYNIYVLKNINTGKVYVGLTKKPIEDRFIQHCKAAFSKKVSEKLDKGEPIRVILRSLRKHGKDSFEIELLDTAPCLDDACEKERFYINKLNSKVPNGYNLTDGGEGLSGYETPQWLKDFRSEINSGENNYWYGKVGNKHHGYGKSLSEEHLEKLKDNNANSKAISVNGVEYRSIASASEYFNISPSSVKRLINWKDEVEKAQIYRVKFDGVVYFGIKEAARQLKSTKYLLDKRIKLGDGCYVDDDWTFEDFLTYLRTLQTPMRAVEYRGIKYRSLKKLGEDLGLDKDVVNRMLRDGLVKETDEKILRESATSIPVMFNGDTYRSKTHLMETFNIHHREFKRLVNDGYVEVLG